MSLEADIAVLDQFIQLSTKVNDIINKYSNVIQYDIVKEENLENGVEITTQERLEHTGAQLHKILDAKYDNLNEKLRTYSSKCDTLNERLSQVLSMTSVLSKLQFNISNITYFSELNKNNIKVLMNKIVTQMKKMYYKDADKKFVDVNNGLTNLNGQSNQTTSLFKYKRPHHSNRFEHTKYPTPEMAQQNTQTQTNNPFAPVTNQNTVTVNLFGNPTTAIQGNPFGNQQDNPFI